MKTARFILTLSTLMLLGGAAHAANRVGDLPTKTVSFQDLDLSTAQGAQVLYSRIKSAAREVCRGADYTEARVCRARAIQNAVEHVGSPLLGAANRSARDRQELALR